MASDNHRTKAHPSTCRGCRSEHTFGAPAGMGQELQRISGMCLTGYGDWGHGCRHYAERGMEEASNGLVLP